MATKHRAIGLDKNAKGHSAKKYKCPACSQKRFVRYYNFDTGEYLADEFGRCDRQEKCGYFEPPTEEHRGDANGPQHTAKRDKATNLPAFTQKSPIKPVDRALFLRTLTAYSTNVFYNWLVSIVGVEHAVAACKRYFVGTGKDGATIFWQIDKQMRVRTGAKILYGPDGKRDRATFPVRLFKVEDGYTACMFGEHLLYTESDEYDIAIVESEKTAILCSIYLPTIAGKPVLWMAASSVNGITEDKARILHGKTVYLVPDYSVHARMTWGQIPMRKKRIPHPTTGKMQNIPDLDGELQPDFVSYADKLKAHKCKVLFWDAYPEVTDSNDIGDYLVKCDPPTIYKKPNSAKYRLTTGEKSTERIKLASRDEERSPGDIFTSLSAISFKIGQKNGERMTAICERERATPVIERYLNMENVKYLVEMFDIREGIIQPIQDE